MDDAIEAWHEVYLAAAAAASVLLGLIFIAMTLYWSTARNRPPMWPHTGWRHVLMNRFEYPSDLVALGTQTYVMFIYALFFSLLMLLPVELPYMPTLLVVALGLLGSLETGVPIIGMYRRTPYPPSFEQLWRYWTPALSMAMVVVGGFGATLGSPLALYSIGLGVGLLMAVAARNAWDIAVSLGSRG